jgi:dolichol-phosphate mannosyltransferase
MVSSQPKLSIIVPTYNEALNTPILAWLLHKHLSHEAYELIIVDDASPDGTAEVSRRLASLWPDLPLVVLSRPCKMGLGSAYMHGLKVARGELVLLLDADLSHHPK